MTTNTHGLDLSGVTKRKDGSRLWPPELRKQIVALMDKVPPTQLAKDLDIHAMQLYAWRQKLNGAPAKKPKVSKKQRLMGPVSNALPDNAAIIEALRAKRERLLEQAAQFGRTISALENGGIDVETVRLSDALVPVKRRLSAKGRKAISDAAKKRWRTIKRKKK